MGGKLFQVSVGERVVQAWGAGLRGWLVTGEPAVTQFRPIVSRQECWPYMARTSCFSREEKNQDFYVKSNL